MLNLPGRKDWVIESYNFRILKSRDLVLIHNNFVFIFLGEGTESESVKIITYLFARGDQRTRREAE